jgi:hypothetical protein
MYSDVSTCARIGVFEAKSAVLTGLKIHVSPVRFRLCPFRSKPVFLWGKANIYHTLAFPEDTWINNPLVFGHSSFSGKKPGFLVESEWRGRHFDTGFDTGLTLSLVIDE